MRFADAHQLQADLIRFLLLARSGPFLTENLSRIEKLDREGLASHPSRDRLANQGGKIGPQSEEGTVLVQKPVSLVPELGSQSV